MKFRRSVHEDEVVLGFLRSELHSPRFGQAIRSALDHIGGTQLVTDPDLSSTRQNRLRRRALADARGWGTGARLFAGFPETVDWTHGQLEPVEVDRVRYIDYSYWIELSGGSRRPADVPATLERGSLPPWMVEIGTDWCLELAATLTPQSSLDDLIIVGTPNLSELVLLEGHARITALFVAGLEHDLPVHGYVGTSTTIQDWQLF